MCGVIGYVGPGASPELFFQGLKRLEYRGYDSAGIAMLRQVGNETELSIQRAEGKLAALEAKLALLPRSATAGIGHTRWATHGKPSEENAHPHRAGKIVLLHNGIIENYRPLKAALVARGVQFHSQTDTEVAAQLLAQEYESQAQGLAPRARMERALQALVKQLHGAFAFGILCLDTPEVLYAVKQGSPVVLGTAAGANFMASGIAALVEHTRDVQFMEDGEIAILTPAGIELSDFSGKPVKREFQHIDWSVSMMEKGGYRHFMLKEIHEHPQAVAQTLSGRVELETGKIDLASLGFGGMALGDVDRVQILACGTSYYAGCLGRYFIEAVAKIPVEVEIASEYRYRPSTAHARTLVIAVSQSGETADTLHAVRHAKARGAKMIALVNAPGSSIAHACGAESRLHAGPEVGVASTKAFTAQVTSLLLTGLALAQERGSIEPEAQRAIVDDLVKVPALLEQMLGASERIEGFARKYSQDRNMLFIGRGPQWPVAQEGALKLKELSYIHAEAYAGGELKHGPIALIDEQLAVVCVCPMDSYHDKMLSNIEEIKARSGRVLAIGDEHDEALRSLADDFIPLPRCPEVCLPFVTTVPLHLFAYWVAVFKGTDVDQPRNLAKSVTVE